MNSTDHLRLQLLIPQWPLGFLYLHLRCTFGSKRSRPHDLSPVFREDNRKADSAPPSALSLLHRKKGMLDSFFSFLSFFFLNRYF